MKVIEATNFSGGENNYFDQLLIDQSEHASGSINIFSIGGALTKMPGTSELATFTSTASSVLDWIHADDNANSSYQLYGWMQYSGDSPGGRSIWALDFANSTGQPLGYTTGTCSVSGASLISATGSGTSWNTNVSAGDQFRANASATTWRNIASVEDATHLTLTSALPVAVATGSAYTIRLMTDVSRFAVRSLNGSIWSCSTGNVLQQYNGTGVIRITGGPKAAFLESHKNYMFALRTTANESRLSWSAIKDPTSWPANNFIDIEVNKGKGTGMISYGNELIIFKTRTLYAVIGDVFDPANPTYFIRPISVPKSFLFNSPNSICIHKGVLYFFSHGIIYTYIQGTNYVTPISSKYQYDFLTSGYGALTDTHTIVDADYHMASFGDYIAFKGIVPRSAKSAAARVAALISDDNRWWYMSVNAATSSDGLTAGPFAVVSPASSRPRLIMGSVNSPALFAWDYMYGPAYTSNFAYQAATSPYAQTSAISSTYVSKEFNVDYAAFKEIIVYLQKQTAGNLTLKYSIDQAAATSVTIDMTTGRGQMIRAVIPVNQKGSTIQVQFVNSTAGQTFLVYGYKILYEPILEDRKA